MTMETKTRNQLAWYWSVVATILLAYILVKHSEKMEIVTLIIGLLGGTILNNIFGVYFSGTTSKQKQLLPGEEEIKK